MMGDGASSPGEGISPGVFRSSLPGVTSFSPVFFFKVVVDQFSTLNKYDIVLSIAMVPDDGKG
jgi:hypothetical protein